MNTFQPFRQSGAALLIALIMLLILTVLAVSSMRGVTLESRITGNRAVALQLQSASDAALREAEYRYFNPYNLREKLEADKANCALSNILVEVANKPCLLAIKQENLNDFWLNPLTLTSDYLKAESEGGSLWMRYRGLDYNQETTIGHDASGTPT
ncbi:Pilus assembly protein PilX OS=Stutzerimonas stutzeri OX=316 GN=CXL00_14490 PE=4 SV=1 [Stutzerimonas stutzeri]